MTFSALVSYPGYGSMWLTDVHLRDGYIVGQGVMNDSLPNSDASEYGPYNFPLSCVRKIKREGGS